MDYDPVVVTLEKLTNSSCVVGCTNNEHDLAMSYGSMLAAITKHTVVGCHLTWVCKNEFATCSIYISVNTAKAYLIYQHKKSTNENVLIVSTDMGEFYPLESNNCLSSVVKT